MPLLFKIGFLPIRIWDILDILIVAWLLYQIYRLLRGNVAFNIFVGLLLIYIIWGIVNQLEMDLLAAVLGQFVSVGMIIIVIVFQQEIRRFLFYLGNNALRRRLHFLDKWLDRNLEVPEGREIYLRALKTALLRLSRQKIGALVVLTRDIILDEVVSTGSELDAAISEPLVESIFQKTSPLHDGALLVRRGRLIAAGCILPISENNTLPKFAGLRHRAALGITEKFGVAAFVVSEESGNLAFAHSGKLFTELQEEEVEALLRQYLL
jgi:diadenylate cyclase